MLKFGHNADGKVISAKLEGRDAAIMYYTISLHLVLALEGGARSLVLTDVSRDTLHRALVEFHRRTMDHLKLDQTEEVPAEEGER